jgi:serine/threonine protein kinase
MEKYKRVKHLGEGSFGTVYLVQNEKGLKYAMKKIKMNSFYIEDALK